MTEPLATEDDTTAPTTSMNRRRRLPTWSLVVLGLGAGAIVGLGAASLVGDGGEDPPTLTLAPVDTVYPADQAGHAEQFLDAWRRYREATFVAELTYERVLPDGQRLAADRLVVQDPPRRLVRQGSSVTTSDEDQTLLCEPVNDEIVCKQHAGVDYAATIDDEIAAWRTAISGRTPPYAVQIPEPGCFDLQLVAELVAPPYGDATRVCFDEETGAIRSRQITRATGTDTEQATRISGTVTAADFESAGG